MRGQLGAGNLGKVAPDSSFIHQGNTTGWGGQGHCAKCSDGAALLEEVRQPLGFRRDPSVEGAAGGTRAGLSRTPGGASPGSMPEGSAKPLRKDPADVHCGGGFVSILGPH